MQSSLCLEYTSWRVLVDYPQNSVNHAGGHHVGSVDFCVIKLGVEREIIYCLFRVGILP